MVAAGALQSWGQLSGRAAAPRGAVRSECGYSGGVFCKESSGMHRSLAPRGDLRCRRELPAFLSGAGESRARRGPLVLSRRGAASCKQLFLLCGLSKQESICPSAAQACLLPGSVLFFFFLFFSCFFSEPWLTLQNMASELLQDKQTTGVTATKHW